MKKCCFLAKKLKFSKNGKCLKKNFAHVKISNFFNFGVNIFLVFTFFPKKNLGRGETTPEKHFSGTFPIGAPQQVRPRF